MKINLYRSLIVILLVGCIGVGCKQKTGAGAENKIQFDSILVDKQYHLMNNPEYPNCDLQIRFTFPVKYSDKTVLAAIQKQFVSSFLGEMYEELAPKEAIEKYTELYLEDYKQFETDFKKELESPNDLPIESWFSYNESSANEITYNSNDILCYSIQIESYTGGAHGAHSSMNYVLDLTTGRVITEEDIFVDDFQDAIAQMLVDDIANQNEVKNPKELEAIGFFSVDEIFPNGNFLVDEEGITYYFNEYEIAAYVVGITSVTLPYKQIKHLLRTNSPISKLI